MSLNERVFGIETEYAMNFYAHSSSKTPSFDKIAEALQEALIKKYGISGCDFLVNGSRFYNDRGHSEWSTPECRSAHEVAVYDKAAEASIAQIISDAVQLLAHKNFKGDLLVAKNNMDTAGHSYGCHENYLMLRDNELLSRDQFLHYMTLCLIPFLTTRQIFSGTGRLIVSELDGRQLSEPVFVLSQRAEFINAMVSARETAETDRPIVDFSRDVEPHASEKCRRLHLILGDSNLSDWATWIKVGTTGIVLRMIEDVFIREIPILQAAVKALKTVSSDTTCRSTVMLQDGRSMNAIDIQSNYYELARDYLRQFGSSDEENELMHEWGQALEDLEQEPMRLADRTDWAIKKKFLDSRLRQLGFTFDNFPKDRSVLTELQAIDLLHYHNISSEGIFNRLKESGKLATCVTATEVQKAQRTPPPYTRAKIRGDVIARARQSKPQDRISEVSWAQIKVKEKRVDLSDPLEFANHQLSNYLRFDQEWWQNCIASADASVCIRAIRYLIWQENAETLSLLKTLAQGDESEQVRFAAVEALGKLANKSDQTVMDVLITLLNDPNLVVRWAAYDALEQMNHSGKLIQIIS